MHDTQTHTVTPIQTRMPSVLHIAIYLHSGTFPPKYCVYTRCMYYYFYATLTFSCALFNDFILAGARPWKNIIFLCSFCCTCKRDLQKNAVIAAATNRGSKKKNKKKIFFATKQANSHSMLAHAGVKSMNI